MKHLFLLIALISSLVSFAQNVNNPGSLLQANVISGKITDAPNSYLPGVNITLIRLPDSVAVARTQTEAAGVYQFKEVAPGSYFIQAFLIGMKKNTSTVFMVTQSAINLPDILLLPDNTTLQEVTITGQKLALEVKDGKLIYNVAQQVAASGNSAFGLLQRTPGISTDQNDNLLLKGNANVNIMVDGKMTYLSPQQLSNLLKSMPAENLATIEIISNPSSQFDAAGNAGIINIVTKKSNKQGYALNINSGVGTGRYSQTAQNIVGNIKTKIFNVFGSYSYNYKHDYLSRTSLRTISNNNETTIFNRSSFDPTRANNHSYRAGIDLYIGKNQELGFLYSGFQNLWKRTGAGPTILTNPAGITQQIVQNRNETREPSVNNAANVNYRIKLDAKGKELTVDADYSAYNNNSSGLTGNQRFSPGDAPLEAYQELAFEQPSKITIRSLKSDLVLPFKTVKVNAGVKYSFVTSDNNFAFDSLINNTYLRSATLSNYFIYKERILAGYSSATLPIGKNTLDVGIRVESTFSSGNSVSNNILTERRYTNLFPYVSITRETDKNNKFSLAVTRRINRPAYADLNPARYFFDKFSYYEGNPLLQPEKSWNLAATYTLLEKYIATLAYTRTAGSISNFAELNNATGELRTSVFNFSEQHNYDALFIVPVSLSNFWEMQNTLNFRHLTYSLLDDKNVFKPSKFIVDVSSTQSFKLPASISAEFSVKYTTPTLSGVYVLKRYFNAAAGFKKSFFKNKLDANLTFTDIFDTIHYWGYSVYQGANLSYNHTGDFRRVNLSFTYRIGGSLSTGKDRKLEEEDRVK